MKTRVVLCLATIGVLAVPGAAQAVVIGFEDLLPSTDFAYVPANYAGLTWSGGRADESWVVSAADNIYFGSSTAHSGNVFAWSNGGADLTISDGLFNLNSFWARKGSIFQTGTTVVSGFNGATQIFSQAIVLTDTYQLFNFNFTGITNLSIVNPDANTLVDDINLDIPGASAVPLGPMSPLFTFSFGILGFLGFRYTRKSPALVAA